MILSVGLWLTLLILNKIIVCLVHPSPDEQASAMRNSPFAYVAVPPHHPDSILSNVNNNNSNSSETSVDKTREVSMETSARHVVEQPEMQCSTGSGDDDERRSQFVLVKQNSCPVTLQHSMEFRSGNSLSGSPLIPRAAYYGQPRRMGGVPPGFSTSGASFPSRHFPWCKPNQPCLPSVGEEETERPRTSPSVMEDAPSPTDEPTSPIIDVVAPDNLDATSDPPRIYNFLANKWLSDEGEVPDLETNNGKTYYYS